MHVLTQASNRCRHTLEWFPQSGCAILDQGLFAGSHFLLNVLLARWLEPAEYGTFALVYSVLVCLGTLHTALLTEPMLIFGAGKYAACFAAYLKLLGYGHWGMTSLMSLLMGAVALGCWSLGSPGVVVQSFAILSLTLPCILWPWFLRRAFYVHAQPHWAALGGGLYLLCILGGLQMLFWCHWLTAMSALLVMGAGSLGVGGVLLRLLQPPHDSASAVPTFATALTEHWRYGTWASATHISLWISREMAYALLPVWVGLEGSGAVRALMNLVMPLLQANAALAILLLPRYVAALHHGGPAYAARGLRWPSVVLLSAALLYWGVLVLWRHPLLLWLYGSHYTIYADILVLAGLLPLAEVIHSLLSVTLRAAERQALLGRCHLVALGVTLTVGLWLLATHGVAGAILGRLLAACVVAGVLLWCSTAPAVRQAIRQSRWYWSHHTS